MFFLMTGFERSEDASQHDHCGGTDLTTHPSVCARTSHCTNRLRLCVSASQQSMLPQGPAHHLLDVAGGVVSEIEMGLDSLSICV
jgi:hypothetical protein